MATSFTVNKADLEFILRQIKIGEATSVAYDSTPLTIVQAIQAEYNLSAANAAMSSFGIRTVDGSMNNTTRLARATLAGRTICSRGSPIQSIGTTRTATR